MTNDTGQTPSVNLVAELDVSITGRHVRQLLYLEATNTFLITFTDRNMYFVNGSFDTAPRFAAQFDNDFKMSYNLSSGAVVAVNDRRLGYRGRCGETFCLATILDAPPDENAGWLRLEMAPTEAAVWTTLRQTLRCDDVLAEPLASLKRYKSFMAWLDAVAEAFIDEWPSICVTLAAEANGESTDLTIDSLNTDLREMGEQMRRQDYINPGFVVPTSLILGLLERITMRRFPAHPFHADRASVERDGGGRMNHIVDRLKLCSEAVRRLTYNRWPHPEYPRACAPIMAEAGFYHNPMCANEDRVNCFVCDVSLVIWEPGDDPSTEHQRHAQKCTFAGGPTHGNIPRAATMSGLGAVRWTLDDDDRLAGVVVGNAASGCDWLAMSATNEQQTLNWAPEIRLYNLNGISEMFHYLTINIGAPAIANTIGLRPDIGGRKRPSGGIQIGSTSVQPPEGYFTPPEKMDEVAENVATVVTALATFTHVDPNDKEGDANHVIVFTGLSVEETAFENARTPYLGFHTTWWIGHDIDLFGNFVNSDQTPKQFRPCLLMNYVCDKTYRLDFASNTTAFTQSASLAQPETSTATMDVDAAGGAAEPMEIATGLTDGLSTALSEKNRTEFSGPIALYDQHDLHVRATTCIPLPGIINSCDYRIDHLVCSDSVNPYVAVGVNRIADEFDEQFCPHPSAIVIYAVENMKAEFVMFYPYQRHISQILVLPWDYFANRSTKRRKAMSSVIVRFVDGTLALVDPNRKFSMLILEDRKVVSVELSRIGAFAALTTDGMLLAYDIKPTTQRESVDVEEARAIALISTLSTADGGGDAAADFDERFRAKLRTQSISPDDDVLSDSLIYQPLNTKNLSAIWSLTRARHPAISSKPNSARLSNAQIKFATNTLSDFQIHAPFNWTIGHLADGFGDEEKWRFSPQNIIQQRALMPEKFDSCLFQLQILPCSPFSHVNITLKFHKYARSCPDVQMSVLRFRAGQSLYDLLGEVGREPSFGAKVNVGGELSEYGLRLALNTKDIVTLKRCADVVVGPVPVRDYVISDDTYVIQLNSTLLYTGICDETTIDCTQWMGVPQKFYVLFESLSVVSPEQLMWEKMKETSLASHMTSSSAVKRSKSGEKMDSNKSKKKRSAHKEDDATPRSPFTSISFAVYASDNSVPKDKLQRILLLKERKIHAQLLRIAAGLTSGVDDDLTKSQLTLAESQALDILLWLVETWRVCPDQYAIIALEQEMRSLSDAIFRTGFVAAPTRSIPQKWTMIIREFIRLLRNAEPFRVSDLLLHFVNVATDIVSNLHRFEMSSALTWFFTILTVILRGCLEPLINEEMTIAVAVLLTKLLHHTDQIGKEWRIRWEHGLNAEMARKCDMSGLVFEQALFEHPSRVLSVRTQTGDATPANATTMQPMMGGGPPPGFYPTMMPPMMTASIPFTMNFPIEQYGVIDDSGLIAQPSTSKSGGKKNSSTPAVITPQSFGNVMNSMSKYYFCVYPSADGSTAMLPPISIGASVGLPPPFMAAKFPGFSHDSVPKPNDPYFLKTNPMIAIKPNASSSIGQPRTTDTNDSKGKYYGDRSKHATITFLREHAVDEITWLQMSEGKGTPVPSSVPPSTTSSRLGLNIKPSKPTQLWAPEQAPSQSVYVFSNGAESVRSRGSASKGVIRHGDTVQRKVICGIEHMPGLLEMEPLAFFIANVSEPMNCVNVDSGETFPLPSSAKAMSPMKKSTEKNKVKPPTSTESTSTRSMLNQSWLPLNQAPRTDVLILPESTHFQSPDILSLSVERMTAAVVKTVILDFGDHVLLTDMIVPACEYVSEVAVGASCTADRTDYVCLLTSTEVCKKCLTITDIQLPVFARYVIMTFTSRRLYDFPCIVPLPQFFGTRFYSAWQTYSAANFGALSEDVQDEITRRLNENDYRRDKLRRLYELADRVDQRYKKSVNELKQRFPYYSKSDVMSGYTESVQLQLEWNRIMFAIRRLERDMRPAVDELAGEQPTLRVCRADQLRCIGLSALSFATRTMALMSFGSLEESSPIDALLTDVITIDLAVRYFESFCCETVPQLQLQCCTWLFNTGNASSWWSDFFPTILRKFFGDKSRKMDSIFYVLSYLCCESVVYQHLQKPIVQKLLEFVDEELNIAEGPNIPRLSRALLLISSAFDVITPLRKKRDRWTFLTGDLSTDDTSRRMDEPSTLDLGKYANYNKKSSQALMNALVSAKKKYVKVANQLQQAQQMSAADILKIKEHLKAAEAALKSKSEYVLATLAESDLKKAFTTWMKKLEASGDGPLSDIGEFSVNDEVLLDMPAALGVAQPYFSSEQKYQSIAPPPGLAPNTQSATSRSAAASRSTRTKSGASTGRHFSVRLRVAPELCLRVLRSIVRLCGGKSAGHLQLLTQLIAFKVIAKIAIHGSHKLIPFSAIFENGLDDIVVKILSNDCNKWVRYALLQMFLDLTEAEICAYQKRVFNEFSAQESPTSDGRQDGSSQSASTKWCGPKRRKETEDDTEDDNPIQAHQINYINHINDSVAAELTETIAGNDSSPSSLTTISDHVADAMVNDISMEDATRAATESLMSEMPSTSSAAAIDDRPTTSDAPAPRASASKCIDNAVLRFDINCQLDAKSVFLQPSDIFAVSTSGASQCGSLVNSARTRRVALLLCDLIDRALSSRQSLIWNQIAPSSKYCRQAKFSEEANDFESDPTRTSVVEIISILHGMIRTLKADTVGDRVAERLLDFYWLYHSSISAFLTKASSALNNFDNFTHLKIPLLSLEAIESLIRFAVNYTHMDESLWSKTLRIIEYTLAKAEDFGALSCSIARLDVFQPFVECFCVDSLNKFRNMSTEGSYGPVLSEVFAQLLDRLFRQPSADLLNKLVVTLCNMLVKDELKRLAVRHFPLDVLMEISSALAANIQKYVKFCDTALISLLYGELLDFTLQYITSILAKDARAHDNRISDVQSRSTTICFTSLLSIPEGKSNGGFATSSLFKSMKKAPAPKPKSYSAFGAPPLVSDASKNVPKHLRDMRESTHRSRYETIICNLMRVVCVAISEVNDLCMSIIYHNAAAIRTAIDILMQCRSNEYIVDNIAVDYWNSVSVADLVLVSLLTLSQRTDLSNYMPYLRIILQQLERRLKSTATEGTAERMEVVESPTSGLPMSLSMPLAVFLATIIDNESTRNIFIELGGHLIVGEQVDICVKKLIALWPPTDRSSFTKTMLQLRAISSQILGKESNSVEQKLPNINCGRDASEWINYAPHCTASSSTLPSSNLQTLLAYSASHRRSRNVWSAVYLTGQEWIDITLTLPHPIILHEVVIKPPAYTVHTKIPSSIQVEVCTNESWTTLGCPMSIHNLHRISISAKLYPNIVSAVRIYLRRPTEVNIVSLSQIVLFGSSACHLDCSAELDRQEANLRHWLPLLNRLSLADEPLSVWNYAPQLPERLTELFLGQPLYEWDYELLQQLFFNLDYVTRGRPTAIIQLIVDYIASGKPIELKVHGYLTALLYNLCRCSSVRKLLPTSISLHTSGSMAIGRQRQLLYGVAGILDVTADGHNLQESKKAANTAMAIWAAACALWENTGRDEIRYETIGLALEVGPKIIKHLTELAFMDIPPNCKQFMRLQIAAGGLLGALARAAPKFLAEIIPICRMKARTIPGHRLAAAFGRVCQSASAIRQLLLDGVVDDCLERASTICAACFADRITRNDLYDYLDELTAIVVYLEKLCTINLAAHHLSSCVGSKFFDTLLHLLLNVRQLRDCHFDRNGYAERLAYQKLTTRLRKAYVRLAHRCISWGYRHRDAFALLFSQHLKIRRFVNSSEHWSRCDLVEILNQLIIEDEKIIIHFKDVLPTAVPGVYENELDKWIHPLFGCGQNDFAVTVSLNAMLSALSPSPYRSSTEFAVDTPGQKTATMFDGSNGDELEEDFENVLFNADGTMFPNVGASAPPAASSSESSIGVITEPGVIEDDPSMFSLYCEPYGNPLQAATSVQQLVDDLMRSDSGSFTAPLSTPSLSRCSDGYFVLKLSLRNIGDNINSAQTQIFEPQPRGETTALERFAQIGGLLELSYYLDVRYLYQSMCTYRDESRKAALDLQARNKAIKCVALDGLMKTTEQLSLTLQNFGDMLNLPFMRDEQMEYDTQPDHHDNNEDESMESMTNAVKPTPKFSIFGGSGRASSIGAYDNDDYDYAKFDDEKIEEKSKPMSLYVIAALGVFLRLDGYGQIFVAINRNCAKILLRSALNMNGNTKNIEELIASLRPSTAASKKMVTKTENEMPMQFSCKYFMDDHPSTSANKINTKTALTPTDEELSLYPFTVLIELLHYFSPANVGPARASEMRRMATSLGVFDIVLQYLSHFTRQDGRSPWLRSSQRLESLHNNTVKAIEFVLSCSDHLDNLRQIRRTIDGELLAAKRVCSHLANSGTAFTPFEPPAGMPEGPPVVVSAPTVSASAAQQVPTSSGGSNGSSVDYWAKGTGFGSGTTQQVWNVNEHVAKRRQSEALITCLLKVLNAAFAPDVSASGERTKSFDLNSFMYAVDLSVNHEGAPACLVDADLTLIAQRSCLSAVLHYYLMNDSVLDMSKHIEIYQRIVELVLAIANTSDIVVQPSAYPEFFESSETPTITGAIDVFVFILNSAEERRTLFNQLTNLRQQIDFYLERLSKAVSRNDAPAPSTSVAAASSNANELSANAESVKANDEDGLLKLSNLCQMTCAKIEEKQAKFNGYDIFGMMTPSTSASHVENRNDDFERMYCDAMKPLQFESIPFFDMDGKLRLNFHYSESIAGSGGTTTTMQQSRRLAKEAVTLSSSLPLTASSTIFVRTCEERLDAMKVLITGPTGTPYANGCFEFDVFFPSDFPNVPVDIHLETNGNRRVRFNPNLYDDGKVCLSILNTWRGRPEERWNPSTSTLLQVLVSIQSLILVKEPYFNEPGFERYRESPSGMQASRDYDANIRCQTIRWAMYEMLKNPPLAFKDVIQRHFLLKRSEICAQIDSWIAEMQTDVNRLNDNEVKPFSQSIVLLKQNYELLKRELDKLTELETSSDNLPAGCSSSS